MSREELLEKRSKKKSDRSDRQSYARINSSHAFGREGCLRCVPAQFDSSACHGSICANICFSGDLIYITVRMHKLTINLVSVYVSQIMLLNVPPVVMDLDSAVVY